MRELTKNELDYKEELELLTLVLNKTLLISTNQAGIQTDGRGMRAMKIFTRQTLTAISIRNLLPKPSPKTKKENDIWDICSIASLTRNIIETYLSLYYFGIENITESEAELRFFLLQLHRNVEWYNIRKEEMDSTELDTFENGIVEQKARLKNHPFLHNLTNEEKNRVLKGQEMYKTKSDFETSLPVCKDLRKHYRLLSNLIHPLPLSIERINNDNGRGIGSETDISYHLICVMLSRRYLAATLVDITDKFKNELGLKYKSELDIIRPLLNKGF